MNSFKIQIWVLQTWSNDPFDDFKWNNFEFKVVRDHQHLHLIHCPFYIWINFSHSEAHAFKTQDGFWSNLVKDKLNYLKWKTFEYQVDRDHQDPNFLYRPFFHLRKFTYTILTKSWISHKLYETICEICGFSTTPSQHFVKCKNSLYIKCRSWWVEQYWYSWLFHSRPSTVPKTIVWLWILSKFKIECFKHGQMTHLMTSNETILNTKLLEIIKIYIW